MAQLMDKKKKIRMGGKVIAERDVNFVKVGYRDDPGSMRKVNHARAVSPPSSLASPTSCHNQQHTHASQIPRERVNVRGIKVAFGGVVCDYLWSEQNEVIWPKDWESLMPPPFMYYAKHALHHTLHAVNANPPRPTPTCCCTRYFIHVKEPREIEGDAYEDPEYHGDTIMGAFFVPRCSDALRVFSPHSSTYSHTVCVAPPPHGRACTQDMLYAWLQRGLDDEDILLDAAHAKLEKLQKRLQKTMNRIERLPYANVCSTPGAAHNTVLYGGVVTC